MRITLSIQHRPDFRAMNTIARTALANAINRTLEEAQSAQRATMASRFVERRKAFLDRMVKIASSDRAKPDRLIGRIRIIGPEGAEDRASILTRHEDPPSVTTAPGSYSIDPSVRLQGFFWLPTREIRPQFSALVPAKLYPTNLRMVERHGISGTLPAKVHTTSSGRYQLKGNQRTFVLFGANDGRPIGIFQRRGSHGKGGARGRSRGRVQLYGKGLRDDIRLIWAFTPRIHLKPRLQFYATTSRTINERIGLNYAGFMQVALRSGR